MNKVEKADALLQVIIRACKELEVSQDETMDVIGMAVANLLAVIAPLFGMQPRQMLKKFGREIAKARLMKKEEVENVQN